MHPASEVLHGRGVGARIQAAQTARRNGAYAQTSLCTGTYHPPNRNKNRHELVVLFRHTSLEDMGLFTGIRSWHEDELIVHKNPVAGVGTVKLFAEVLGDDRGVEAREEHLAVDGVQDGGDQVWSRVCPSLFDAEIHVAEVLNEQLLVDMLGQDV